MTVKMVRNISKFTNMPIALFAEFTDAAYPQLPRIVYDPSALKRSRLIAYFGILGICISRPPVLASSVVSFLVSFLKRTLWLWQQWESTFCGQLIRTNSFLFSHLASRN